MEVVVLEPYADGNDTVTPVVVPADKYGARRSAIMRTMTRSVDITGAFACIFSCSWK
jgi:hypothetical protein